MSNLKINFDRITLGDIARCAHNPNVLVLLEFYNRIVEGGILHLPAQDIGPICVEIQAQVNAWFQERKAEWDELARAKNAPGQETEMDERAQQALRDLLKDIKFE